jgi:hypothetical protein
VLEIMDWDVVLRDPITYGAVHVQSHYFRLNASFPFDYVRVG